MCFYGNTINIKMNLCILSNQKILYNISFIYFQIIIYTTTVGYENANVWKIIPL